jgi:membrane protein implicated in regulation of membrane protease activity
MWSYFGLISAPWWHVLAAYAGTVLLAAAISWIVWYLLTLIPAVDEWLWRRMVASDQKRLARQKERELRWREREERSA